jgi:hypothetical protein
MCLPGPAPDAVEAWKRPPATAIAVIFRAAGSSREYEPFRINRRLLGTQFRAEGTVNGSSDDMFVLHLRNTHVRKDQRRSAPTPLRKVAPTLAQVVVGYFDGAMHSPIRHWRAPLSLI